MFHSRCEQQCGVDAATLVKSNVVSTSFVIGSLIGSGRGMAAWCAAQAFNRVRNTSSRVDPPQNDIMKTP